MEINKQKLLAQYSQVNELSLDQKEFDKIINLYNIKDIKKFDIIDYADLIKFPTK